MFERDRQQTLAELRHKMSTARYRDSGAHRARAIGPDPSPRRPAAWRGGQHRRSEWSYQPAADPARCTRECLVRAGRNAGDRVAGGRRTGCRPGSTRTRSGSGYLTCCRCFQSWRTVWTSSCSVPPKVMPPARLRVLTARLRQSGAVLLVDRSVAGCRPGAELPDRELDRTRSVGTVGCGIGN